MRELRVIPRADQATPCQVRAVEAAVALWTVIWIGVAIWTSVDIAHLARWSSLLDSTGATVNRLADALGTFRHAPTVGPGLGASADQLRTLAAQARYGASQSRTAVDQLTYVIGFTIAVVPTVPAVAALFRFLRTRRRERRALSEAFRDDARRPLALRYLAARAVDHLPYPDLLRAGALAGPADSADPQLLIRRLAEAELERLGLDLDRHGRIRAG